MNEEQRQKARKKLYDQYRNFDFLICDEPYFTFSHSTMSGYDRFYSSDNNLAPKSVKHVEKKTFEKKVLV
jgi:hypothetical protein